MSVAIILAFTLVAVTFLLHYWTPILLGSFEVAVVTDAMSCLYYSDLIYTTQGGQSLDGRSSQDVPQQRR